MRSSPSSYHRVSDLLPLPVLRSISGSPALPLVYHVVSDEQLPHIRHLYPYKNTAQFENDLLYLKKNFEFIQYKDFLRLPGDIREWPKNHVLLTFDDGYAECFTVVRPLLLKHRIPCVFFVTTNWIGNQGIFHRNKISLCLDRLENMDEAGWRKTAHHVMPDLGSSMISRKQFRSWLFSLEKIDEPKIDGVCRVMEMDIDAFLKKQQPFMTVEQVKQLVAEGFGVGAHGRGHAEWANLSREQMKAEITESSRIVKEWTGQQFLPFAFPFNVVTLDPQMPDEVMAECPFIRGFFGLPEMQLSLPRLIERTAVDEPPSGSEHSNLPKLVRFAYSRHLHQLKTGRGGGKESLLPKLLNFLFPISLRGFFLKLMNRIRHFGFQRRCPICRAHLRHFLPFGLVPRPEALCPHCESLERHRLIWLFLQRETTLFDGRPKRVLHIAPEKSLSQRIQRIPGVDYLSADLFKSHVMVKMDLTRIQYPDNSFDVSLISHVLQHIPEDHKALSEIFRVLKPGGWALLHEGIRGEKTIEDPTAQTPEKRGLLYGDPSYVRRYGADFKDRVAAHGFDVRVFAFGQEFNESQRAYYGLGNENDLHFCVKPAESGTGLQRADAR